MDVKEAVRIAKEYAADLYQGEQITRLGLEEVVFEESSNSWMITVGFQRPWFRRNQTLMALEDEGLGHNFRDRSYKVIRISDTTGEVESLKDRILVTRD